jgi:E3 ubiquitin-protein ligase MUL1
MQARKRIAQFQEERKREVGRRIAAAARSGATSDGNASAAADGRPPNVETRESTLGGEEDRIAGICVVCIDRPTAVVFASCGHMCCCEQCGSSLSRCPICRIRGRPIKVFRP